MGKRHTAKTGDKALKKREAQLEEEKKASHRKSNKYADDTYDENDEMYDEVDQYHLKRDAMQEEFLSLDASNMDDSESDDGLGGKEAVMDLGADIEDSDSSSDEEEEDETDDDSVPQIEYDEEKQKRYEYLQSLMNEDDAYSSDESEDDEEDEKRDKILNWGRRKHDYYHGDTADLEIGQDVEDAQVEEEAGKEIQKLKYEQIDEDDYMPFKKKETSSRKEGKSKSDGVIEETTQILSIQQKHEKIKKLSQEDKIQFLETQHPEFFPVVNHFADQFVSDYKNRTSVIADQLLSTENGENHAEAIGTNSAGLIYLHQKRMLQLSASLNLSVYLLLKHRQATKEGRYDKTKSIGKGSEIMLNFSSNLGGSPEDAIKDHPVMSRFEEFIKLSDKLQSKIEKPNGLADQADKLVEAVHLMKSSPDDPSSDTDDEQQSDTEEAAMVTSEEEKGDYIIKDDEMEGDYSSSDDEDEDVQELNLMTEARFGVRKEDMLKTVSRRQRMLDYGDDDDNGDKKKASQNLASTINRISQKEKSSKNRSKSGMGDHVDEIAESSRNVSSKNEDDEDEYDRQLKMLTDAMGGDVLPEDGEDGSDHELDEEDEFYELAKKKSMKKKEMKKNLYAVAPKYPNVSKIVDGERAIGRMIMKNRGLVPHKNKLNRNPRVKKREQYRKALIKRKGQVREVRTGEVDAYGGETTGIKSGLSRSRKLGKS